MGKTIAAAIAILSIGLLACAGPALAARGDIWLGSQFLLRIRTAAGGFSIDQRVEAIQQRANNLLQEGKTISEVTVEKAGYDANILTDGQLFMTVTAADAQANATTVEGLANKWAQRIRRILPKTSIVKPGVGPPLR